MLISEHMHISVSDVQVQNFQSAKRQCDVWPLHLKHVWLEVRALTAVILGTFSFFKVN